MRTTEAELQQLYDEVSAVSRTYYNHNCSGYRALCARCRPILLEMIKLGQQYDTKHDKEIK